jgi:asparagine synthetase B (glutamine-hydrolysing)
MTDYSPLITVNKKYLNQNSKLTHLYGKSIFIQFKKNCIKSKIFVSNNSFLYLYGEIYNNSGYKLIDEEIEKLFYKLMSGELNLNYLHSQFFGSFVLVFSHQKSFQVIVDKDNSIRLFNYKDEIFSNSIPKIIELTRKHNLKLTPNKNDFDFYYIYGFFPHSRTQFNEVTIYKDLEKQDLELNNFKNSKNMLTDDNQILEELNDLFLEGLKEQTKGYDNIAVLLGGFDSSLVAAGLKKIGKSVKGFTFRYETDKYNQTLVEECVKFLGIEHEWLTINKSKFFELLEKFKLISSFPTVYPLYVLQSLEVCKIIESKGFKYIQTGDGCDDLFYGYPKTYSFNQLRSKLFKKFSFFKLFILRIANLFYMQLGHLHTVLTALLKNKEPLVHFRLLDEYKLKKIKLDTNLDQISKTEFEILKSLENLSSIRKQYSAKSLLGTNKTKLNTILINENVFINSPFFYKPLKKFITNLDDRYLRSKKNKLGKEILIKMATQYKYLPEQVIFQKKIAAVISPIDNWYFESRNLLLVKLEKYLPNFKLKFIKRIFKNSFFEKIYLKFFSSDGISTHFLSAVITLHNFYELEQENS